jgi:hypothetical protein
MVTKIVELSRTDIQTMIKIADYFNITVDFLIGHKMRVDDAATIEEETLLTLYRNLTPELKASIMTIIKNIKVSS